MAGDLTHRLAKFFDACIDTAFDGGGVDGGTIQDWAEQHGLILETKFDPDQHCNHHGLDVREGDPWFVIADDVERALGPRDLGQ